MFGHQDDTDQNNNDQIDQNNPQADGTLTHNGVGLVPTPQADTGAPDAPQAADDPAGAYIVTEPQHPGVGMAPAASPVVATAPVTVAAHSPADSNLVDIKQKALQQLSPLVGHLDQTPEEKFRTTMMMIQASDDQTLLKSAYESAGQITDEKVRAQALLDVINEINYFTQQQEA